jgi:hypothetical protein
MTVAGADGAAWAAGAGAVMRFDRSGAAIEASEGSNRPMAIGLDEAGAFRKAPAEPRWKGVVARRQAKAARDVALARIEPLAV